MSQTRLGSAAEAAINTAVGFAINYVANLVVLPLFGLSVSPAGALGIGLIFTAISIARSYFMRRVFNHIETRKDQHG